VDASVESLRQAGLAFWMRAAVWSVVIGLTIGVPTVLIDNPFFKRAIVLSR
jgi:hypothetical protein